MLWQNQDQEINSALANSGRDLPTTFGETFQAAWSRNNLYGQQYTGEADRMAALDDYHKLIQQKSGVDLGPELDYTTGQTGVMPASHDLLRQTNDKLAKLKQTNPALDVAPMTDAEFDEAGLAKRRAADADYEETVNRPRGRGATAGLVAGGLVTGLADPLNLVGLTIAPEASVGVVGNALRWGAIGVGTQAVSEAMQAPYREAVQPGYITSGEPLLNIALAGMETAAGATLLHGLAKVWDRVRGGAWPTSVRDAGNIVSSHANVEASNIYPGAEGAAAHSQALNKTIDDALTRQPVDVSQHITPELEARAEVPAPAVEAARTAAAAVARPAPIEAAPELPFERTAAQAEADRFREQATIGVQTMARNAGYEMPAEEAGRVADKLIQAEPNEVQDLLRNLHMSPRQVAEAPRRLEPPADEIATPVEPVADIHAPDFQDALRSDLDRELVSSSAGIPSRAASEAETGLPAPGISSSGVTLPPTTQPLSTSQISMRPAPVGSLITRAITPPETFVGPTTTLGMIDEASNRKILHGSNDLNALRAAAERNKPLADARLAELVAEVPGTEYHGSRVKDLAGLQRKVDPTRPPKAISDYLGARVITETPAAMENFSRRILDTGGVIDLDDFLDPSKEGYRAVHMQVALGDGTSMELQLVPRPIADVQNQAHDLRQPVKRLDLTDPLNMKLYQQEMAKGRAILDNAWTASEQWKELRPNLAIIDARPLPTALPEEHSRYFQIDPTTNTVSLDHLVSSKSEADNARSGSNAAKRMQASSQGELERRRPITVTPLPDGRFLIKDGNATFTAAKQFGWKQLPVRIEPEPGLLPREHALPNGIAMFSPGELGVDAERFQFKAGGDEAGVTDRLRGVKNWDPIKAGQVLTWIDKEGKPWIVDGHQRLALAKRIAAEDPAQNPQIFARTLREDEGITAEHARAIAANKNIAEGTGTAVDAAKIIRDHPKLAEDLPPRSELVRQARGLVNLSDEAFGMVVNEVVPANYAAIVGRLVPADPAMQTGLLNLLAKTDPANAVQAEAIARQGIEAGFRKAEAGAQASLFGEQDVAESLYSERAKVLDRALKTLRRDKMVFGTLVKEQETIERAATPKSFWSYQAATETPSLEEAINAGAVSSATTRDEWEQLSPGMRREIVRSGNKLAKDINQQRMTADGQALQILQTLANRSGPISDALRTAAGRAKSDGYAAATREFVETVREAASSGDLARLANGLERGASHVGDQGAANIIDHGIAAEPSKPDAIAPTSFYEDLMAGRAVAGAAARAREAGTLPGFEPGAEGLPQGIMPGMEPSARQLAAARAGPLRPGVAQQAPGGLFAPAEERTADMFPNIAAGGQPVSLQRALNEADGYKIAAEQLAACAAPAEAA